MVGLSSDEVLDIISNIKDVDKCYLPIIKEKIDKLEKITDYHKYVYTINEFNGLSEIEYPKYKYPAKKSIPVIISNNKCSKVIFLPQLRHLPN